MTREELIEVGARALDVPAGDRSRTSAADLATAVIDAIEPIIRADEERIQHDGRECVCARTEADTEERLLKRLRAQVEGLRVVESRVKGRRITVLVDRADVLTLIEEVDRD